MSLSPYDLEAMHTQAQTFDAKRTRRSPAVYPEWIVTFYYGDAGMVSAVTVGAQNKAQAITQFQREWPGIPVYQVAQVVESRPWVLKG